MSNNILRMAIKAQSAIDNFVQFLSSRTLKFRAENFSNNVFLRKRNIVWSAYFDPLENTWDD
tara:strand:- start:271 stop:456 length:186 start_codon:yes stop_codon:yes gene_type:complete